MIFIYGSRLTSKSKSYKHESAPSTENKLKSATIFISGSNIGSSDKSKPVVKNEVVPVQPLSLQRGRVVIAASTERLPLFDRDDDTPSGIMTPNAMLVAGASRRGYIPPEFCGQGQPDDGPHPVHICYYCKDGRWTHADDVYKGSMHEGCFTHVPVIENGRRLCKRIDTFPDAQKNCQRCLYGNLEDICDSCEKCVNARCENDCPSSDDICFDGRCSEPCNDSTTCNYLQCLKCRLGVCQSSCSGVDVCNGYGKCMSPCYPACNGCEECVQINGVYGCRSLEDNSCNRLTRAICCNGQLKHPVGCEYLDENCNIKTECSSDLCMVGINGCSYCTTRCSTSADCDVSNCEICEENFLGDKVCLGCIAQYNDANVFCDGKGTCVNAEECNGCQELRLKPECAGETQPTIDCMHCVEVCGERMGPDGNPLTCAPDPFKPADVFCQYQPLVVIASIIP